MGTETLKDRLIEYARRRGLKIISANIYICIERYSDEESDEVTIEKRLALLPKKYTKNEYNKFLDLLDVEEYSDEHRIKYILGTIYFNKGEVVNIYNPMDKGINILQGDAIELFKTIDSDSVDLIIADPPYNLNKDYGNDSDCKSFDDYLVFTRKWTKEACRVLKPTGTIYIFMGFRFISYLYNILEQENKLRFNNWICWYYTQGIGKKRGFSPRHDDILMFTKTDKFIFNLDDIRIPQKYYRSVNNMRGANPGDVWEFSHIHYCQDNRQNHPTQKPEGLMERMILASSNENDLILDPFAGSGTTLRVCQQLKRKCLGFELSIDYVEQIKKRLLKPFEGFDSIDPRMERVPNDLNDKNIREEYLDNHVEWFLKNHDGAKEVFFKEVKMKYGHKHSKSNSAQKTLFD